MFKNIFNSFNEYKKESEIIGAIFSFEIKSLKELTRYSSKIINK